MDVPMSVWDADRESFGCNPPQCLSEFTLPPKHSLSPCQPVFLFVFLMVATLTGMRWALKTVSM